MKSASISAAQVQTPDQLQGLIIAAQHVVDAANGIAGDASPKPNAADFLALGLDKSKLDAAGATGVAMLADTVDANTLSSLSTDEAGRAIALPDKLAQLLDLIQSLMVTAAGGVANPPLDPVQLGKLGVNLASVAHNPDGSPQNWSAILAAIAGSKKDGSEVNTLAKLQALVNRADAAQTKIRLYADDAVSATDAATTPSPDDYRSIGLVNPVADANGVRAPLVTADNVGAVNAALRTSAINAAQADTPASNRTSPFPPPPWRACRSPTAWRSIGWWRCAIICCPSASRPRAFASASNRFRRHASPARKAWKSVSRRPSEEARCQMPQVPSRKP